MVTEVGHFALILAMMVALFQIVVPMVGAHNGDRAWMRFAAPAAVVQVVLVSISFAALTYAFIGSDFSLQIVYANSHSAKPMLYKITGVWGNHEGSMLLWVLILAIYGAAVALFGRNLPPTLKARVISIQALVALGFYLFILFTSNPFSRLFPPPSDGKGLNPLLQDPGLAFHPPFLYLGYVGFSIAFSFAIAALIEGRVDAAWARWVRPWTLAAWSFLTVGIGLGSWWAYYELGWGGWWFWDPVENASFMPWLAGTALLHSSIVVEKRNALKGWTIFLAIVAFSFSLLGTFIVRSGVLTSVHSFAADPERGVFILVLLLFVVGGSFALFAMRGPELKTGGLFQPVSREGALLLNNLIMMVAAAVVLLGTMYPLFIDAISGDKISVGPPFFEASFVPLMVPMLFAMAIGPLLAWKRGDLPKAINRLKIAIFLSLAAVVGIWLAVGGTGLMAALGLGLGVWVILGTLTELFGRVQLLKGDIGASLRRLATMPRSTCGMTIAHIGLGVAILGMVGSSAGKVEKILVMKPNETVQVEGYDYKFIGVRQFQGPNYVATQGKLVVSREGTLVTNLYPEDRQFPVEGMPTTEAAIHTMASADLYVALGKQDANTGGWVVRIYHNPLVVWIWTGLLMLVGGGMVSLTDRRHRVGAPQRSNAVKKNAKRAQPAE